VDNLEELRDEENNHGGPERSDVLLGVLVDIHKVNNEHYILAEGVDNFLTTLRRVQRVVPLMAPAPACSCKVVGVKSVGNQRMPCC